MGDELRRVSVWSWSGIAGLAVALAVASWLAWPGPAPEAPPRAKEYRDVDICLLTDQQGIAGPQAAPVWAALRQVSDETKARVNYLAVLGEQSEQRAAEFAASLVQQRCVVIVAVGEHQVAAVTEGAPRWPEERFVAVEGKGSAPNLSNVTSDAVAAHVRPLVG